MSLQSFSAPGDKYNFDDSTWVIPEMFYYVLWLITLWMRITKNQLLLQAKNKALKSCLTETHLIKPTEYTYIIYSSFWNSCHLVMWFFNVTVRVY